MTHNFCPPKITEHPIDSIQLAGFSVKSLPDTVSVTTWAGDVELKVSLNREQAAKLAGVLISGCANFVGAERIRRFNPTTHAN